MIVLRNVVVTKDVTILNHVNLEFPSGKIIGLLGPSGAGKTTLMRAIAGLQRLSEGSIHVFGMRAGDKSLRKITGYSTQSSAVYLDLTVAENLAFFASLYDNSFLTIEEVVVRLGLEHVRNQIAHSLSGGERSRLALATALVSPADLLILDEPTVGLDPVLRRQLWTLFRELSDSGKTVLVSSHVMDEAERCDEICLLREGRVLAQGSVAELKARTDCDSMEEVFLALVNA